MTRRGIDLSSNNAHPINWGQLAPNVDVVWVKATQYTNYVNPYAMADAFNAKAHGLEVWLYHFAGDVRGKPPYSVMGTPNAEADHFLSAAQKIPHDGLCLDYEVQGIPIDPNWVSAFLSRSSAGMVYSYSSMLTVLLPVTRGRRHWIADYRPTPPPGIWDAWQYTDKGTVPGISGAVDLSHVYWASAPTPQPPIPLPPPKEYVVTTLRVQTVVMTLGADGKGWGLTAEPVVNTYIAKENGSYTALNSADVYTQDYVLDFRAFVQEGRVQVVVEQGKPRATVTFEVLEFMP